MPKVTNLNRFRKSRARDEKKARAEHNAAYHGLTKAEKERAKAEAERVRLRHLATGRAKGDGPDGDGPD